MLTSVAMVSTNKMFCQFAGTIEKEHLCQEWACFTHMLVNDFKELSVKKLMIVMAGDVSFSMLYPTLDHSCNKWSDLFGQQQVSKSDITPTRF